MRLPYPDKKGLARFHKALHAWYAACGRKDLPWRNTDDAYAIYVSEIMLQQTQVATVLSRFYAPFLKRFPTLAALATAEREEVLSAWQGLGYYNRAIHLHEAAKRAGKSLPRNINGLMALPGIGRNTAHAVAAFAYRQPVAVMEANVKRVLSRVFSMETPSDQSLWEGAGSLLDTQNPFDYNQAMMDIGALVCTRRAPACGECPASGICTGKASPESYPAPRSKKSVPVRRKNIFVFQNAQGKYFAQPRESRFLRGLYHFVEADRNEPFLTFLGTRHAVAEGEYLGDIRQQYSHFTLEASVYRMESVAKNNRWYDYDELARLPLSMAEQKILLLLAEATAVKKRA